MKGMIDKSARFGLSSCEAELLTVPNGYRGSGESLVSVIEGLSTSTDNGDMTTTDTHTDTWNDIDLTATSTGAIRSMEVMPKGDYMVHFRNYPSVRVSSIGACFACLIEREARRITFRRESFGIPFALETVGIALA